MARAIANPHDARASESIKACNGFVDREVLRGNSVHAKSRMCLKGTNVPGKLTLVGLGKSGGEGGIRTPGRSFSPYNGLAKRVIARWLAGNSLKTKDAVRLALDGLGTVGRLLG